MIRYAMRMFSEPRCENTNEIGIAFMKLPELQVWLALTLKKLNI
jgi:hypothetical protein